jgi:hypothetical protein
MNRRQRAWAAGGLAASMSVGFVVGAPALADGPPRTSELRVTQIVARGVRNGENACDFAGSTPTTQNVGSWLAMSISSDCVVTITESWNGSLNEGPPRFASVDDEFAAEENPALESVASLRAATTCKTAKQLFFTYGFGGAALDKLTKVWTSLTYCYNDSYVWGSSTAGSACGGTNPGGWNWVVDQCVISSQSLSQSQTSVWNELRGNFHCNLPTTFPCHLSNPDGYFHRLWARVTAYDGGASTCTNHWDGFVVLGPEMQILSGCQ